RPSAHAAWPKGHTGSGSQRRTAPCLRCRACPWTGRSHSVYSPAGRPREAPHSGTRARRRTRSSMLGCVTVFGLLLAGICGCWLGLGLLLHWLVPAIDRGMATLCGLVATGLALRALAQLMTLTEPSEVEEEAPPVWRLRPLPRPARAPRRPRKRP